MFVPLALYVLCSFTRKLLNHWRHSNQWTTECSNFDRSNFKACGGRLFRLRWMGSFDVFAVVKHGAGADERDEQPSTESRRDY